MSEVSDLEKRKMKRVMQLINELYDKNAESQIDLQTRLRELTRTESIPLVAMSAGLTVSTLSQYLRVKHPHNIGLKAVSQAESILAKLHAESK